MAQHLRGKHEVVNSIPSTRKQKRSNQQEYDSIDSLYWASTQGLYSFEPLPEGLVFPILIRTPLHDPTSTASNILISQFGPRVSAIPRTQSLISSTINLCVPDNPSVSLMIMSRGVKVQLPRNAKTFKIDKRFLLHRAKLPILSLKPVC